MFGFCHQISPLTCGSFYKTRIPYSWITHTRPRLHLNHSLDELDAANSHTHRGIIPHLEDPRLDRRHFRPRGLVIGIGDSILSIAFIRPWSVEKTGNAPPIHIVSQCRAGCYLRGDG